MEREEAKFGEADQSKFKVTDGNELPAHLEGVIVPIMKQLPDTTWELIGTGFYITTNGILATAKHVLTDVLDEKENQLYPLATFHFLPDNVFLKRPIIRCNVHKNADIGIAITSPIKVNKTNSMLTNKILTLSTKELSIDETVFTYAYPNVAYSYEEVQKIYFNPRFYEGKIVEFWPDGRDRTFLPNPCYQTSMVIHGGASGGPVFDTTGAVRGINSTGFMGCPDISFISRVQEILSLEATGVNFVPDAEPENVSIMRLAELGHVTVAP